MISILKKICTPTPQAPLIIAKAQTLFQQGQIERAIALLEALNQRSPSPAVEAKLVHMRHQGFFRKTHQSRLKDWPPKLLQSPFPYGHIPSISKDQLSAEKIIQGVIGHGALIVPQLIPKDDCKLLINAVDHAMASYDAKNEADAAWYLPIEPCSESGPQKIARGWVRQGGGVLAADSPRGLFQLIEVLKKADLINLIDAYLGERPALSVKKTTLRRVSPNNNSGWHQDGAFLGKNIRTLNLWIALTDCGIDAPSMDMVPKRLPGILQTGTGAADFSWSLDDATVQQAADDTPVIRLQFKAGDVIFFDELNLHRTACDEHMTQTRYAIEAWFFAPSCYPLNQLPILL